MDVSAKIGSSDPVTVKYDFGETLEELVAKCTTDTAGGAETVRQLALKSAVVYLQDLIRSGITAGSDAKEIQKNADKWVPGVKRRGKSPAEKMQSDFQKLSPEERENIVKMLLAEASKPS